MVTQIAMVGTYDNPIGKSLQPGM